MRMLIAAIAGGVAVSGALLAQSTTQSVQGLVTDTSGAVVSGATITLSNEATGISQTVQTNSTGNYTFPLAPVGTYSMRVEMPGFKSETTRGLRVETAAQVRQNFLLQVGQVNETVEVSATAAVLQTENATVGGVIENKRIVELPLNGRNYLQLVALSPNVTTEGGAGGSFCAVITRMATPQAMSTGPRCLRSGTTGRNLGQVAMLCNSRFSTR